VPNFPFVLDYANLYCGSAPNDDRYSNHLVLSELKLPTVEIQYVDHRPGGAPVAIEIDVVMTRLELEFEVVGITPQIMALLRNLENSKHSFFAYGNLRDYLRGNALPLRAFWRGQLAKATPGAFRRGDVFHMRYQVRGIISYTLYIGEGDNPIYRWDFFNNEFKTGDYLGG
jgi:P2 family phage contractile tail tube protein